MKQFHKIKLKIDFHHKSKVYKIPHSLYKCINAEPERWETWSWQQFVLLTLRAGFASGWKTDKALRALTSTPIGCASWGIACMRSYKTM